MTCGTVDGRGLTTQEITHYWLVLGCLSFFGFRKSDDYSRNLLVFISRLLVNVQMYVVFVV